MGIIVKMYRNYTISIHNNVENYVENFEKSFENVENPVENVENFVKNKGFLSLSKC